MDTQNSESTVDSEIALFFEQWEKEVEATQLALRGYAVTARHDFISRRMQSFGKQKLNELKALDAKKKQLDAQNQTEPHENSL
jgi:hypothetical protein